MRFELVAVSSGLVRVTSALALVRHELVSMRSGLVLVADQGVHGCLRSGADPVHSRYGRHSSGADRRD
jgi:hypothetical protein